MVAIAATPTFTLTAKGLPLTGTSLKTNGFCIGRSALPSANNAHQKSNALVCFSSKIRVPISATSIRAIATEEGQLASAESDQKASTHLI
ncbi:hypothetical protein KI387_037517, partial [Taxus chinensis]